jgi:hypothetical protein
MIDIGSLSPTVEAAMLIGIVLVEALILYVGYGFAEELLGQRVIERIRGS